MSLSVKRACLPLLALAGLSAAATPYALQQPPLTTDWTEEVGTNPWPEYPRPQLQRSQWQNLNGIWQYRNAGSAGAVNAPPFGQDLDTEVLVPSCLESGLSGLQGQNLLYSWLSTSFTVRDDWKDQNVLLNFGAVDNEATVFVNGEQVAFHRGGYFEFTVDITEFITFGESNELLVFVYDPTDTAGTMNPVGKQTLNPSHIFYTPCSGIWQSVWLEAAPAQHISRLDLTADMDGKVTVTAHTPTGNSSAPVKVTVEEAGETIASHTGSANEQFTFTVDDVKLWSPDTPNLYNVTVTLGEDKVSSYTGFRTISKGTVDGVVRPLINGEFMFLFGTLDQGYWPDGLYTPPNREAMVYDLKVLKSLGFNMLRKHIKVENGLFYRAADELGLLLIQDMPSMPLQNPNAEQQQEFARQLDLMINQLKSHPSIYTWVIYNEGWAQLASAPEIDLAEHVRQLDPTRLVNAASGWVDHGAGDYSDNHHYANPQCGTPFWSSASSPYDPKRIGIQGEFGGIGHNVSLENLWNVPAAIATIPETYEIDETLEIWNYRARYLLSELREQIEKFACSSAVWTQTTDVEGEVNGLLTYDRRIKRTDEKQWKEDIRALYSAARDRA
ncbi:glycoside hydrolase superfamily [Aspergillus unguis]